MSSAYTKIGELLSDVNNKDRDSYRYADAQDHWPPSAAAFVCHKQSQSENLRPQVADISSIRTSSPIQIETGANVAVSNLPVPMRMKTIAAPFAAIFAVLALIVAHSAHCTVGLPVRIGKTRPCWPYEGDVHRVLVQVLRPGVIKLNGQPLQVQELEGRLEAIFRTRVYRYVLVTGELDLQFGDVADIIDRSMKQVDQVVLVTPLVMSQLAARAPRVCFDENLPREYVGHPPH